MTSSELLQSLEAGGDAQTEALAAIRGFVPRLSFESAGCRAVQLAMEVADTGIAAELVMELHGHVQDLISSPHGNYVIQKAIEVMPSGQFSFIAAELHGVSATVARHRYGCRIFCRLLEHSVEDFTTVTLVDELLAEPGDICRHTFGHHVAQSILENGRPTQKRSIVAALCHDAYRNKWNHSASFLFEKVLTRCPAEDQEVIVTGLLNDSPGVFASLVHRLGPLTKVLSKLPGETPLKALDALRMAAGKPPMSKYKKRLPKLAEDQHSRAQTVMVK